MCPPIRASWHGSLTLWRLILVVALVVLGFGLQAVAQAATPIYVRVDGHDTNCNGTADAPYPGSGGPGLNCAVLTIQRGINLVDPGGLVQVGGGTYIIPAGGRILLNKAGITVQADPALAVRPKIVMNYGGWSDCNIQMAADGVTLEGLEVDNSAHWGASPRGYLVGDYNSAKNNWTVRNCDIHHGRNALRPMGNNVTIENNDLHETEGDLINCEYGTCYGLKVSGNWLHSHHADMGGKPAGLTYNVSSGAPAGDQVEITHNYAWANRTFIDFQHNGGLGPANRILVAHNTVDYWIGDLLVPVGAENAQQMSVAWWMVQASPATSFWNGPNFEIRDNLFSRQRWYAVVNSDNNPDWTYNNFIQGQLLLNRNLFWQWYLRDSWYPGSALPNEWPAARGAVGWANPYLGAGNGFVIAADNLTADPLYVATGSRPDEYYALQYGSPALNAATDGTNIGAWQGQPTLPGTHVSNITGQVVLTRQGIRLNAYVYVVDENAQPLAGATVRATLTVPGQAPVTSQATTDAQGRAFFTGLTRLRGTWTLCVDDVSKAGYSYDPGSNTLTCKSWLY